MLNVVGFADYFGSPSCGGAEAVADQVYRRLAAIPGVRLTVVSIVATADSDARPTEQERAGMRVITVPGRDLSRLVGAQLVASRWLAGVTRCVAAEHPDVVHANGLHFHGSVAAACLARRQHLPLVATAHLGDLSSLNGRQRLSGTVWDATFGRYIIGASTSVVAVSRSAAERVRQLGAGQRPVTVVPNGVDHELFHPPALRRRPGSLHVLFVGRLISNKGPGLLLRAATAVLAQGIDLTVTFVGDGPLRHHLEREAAHLGERVRFVGQSEAVADHLRAADVVVRASYTEGLPLGVLEAMACGTPVICSDVAGNLELVEHGSNGLVFRAGDATGLAQALTRACLNREMLDQLGRRAHLDAAKYSWERSADGHLNALQAALGPVLRPPPRGVDSAALAKSGVSAAGRRGF
jgi:glycosyltransferase involved in cell wall biosynthesis